MKAWVSRDQRALEGLPLKLLIVVLILSISLPSLAGSLDHYLKVIAIENLEGQLDELKSAAATVFLGGPGTVRTINLELPYLNGDLPSTVTIGGERGSLESRSISYKAGDVQGREFLQELPLEITTSMGTGLSVSSPGGHLTLECIEQGNDTWILVGRSP